MDADSAGAPSGAFRRFTVATYVANFDKYDGEQLPDPAWLRVTPAPTGSSEPRSSPAATIICGWIM